MPEMWDFCSGRCSAPSLCLELVEKRTAISQTGLRMAGEAELVPGVGRDRGERGIFQLSVKLFWVLI